MIGLNIGNDSKHMRENNNNHRRSYQFATKNYGKFYVSGISGSLEKYTKEKMEIDRKFIKSNNTNTTTATTNHSKYVVEPVLEKYQRDQLKRDALQLIQLEQKLLDIQRYKECKKRRNELRIRKRLEYDASMKIATAYLEYRDNKYNRAVQMLRSFLHVVTIKQSLSAAAWAARVIKRFAILTSYKWRRYLLHRDYIPAVVNRNWSLIKQVSCMTVQLVRRQVDELVNRWFTLGLRSISRLLAYERKQKQKQQLLRHPSSSRKGKGEEKRKGWKRGNDRDKLSMSMVVQKKHEHDDHLQFFLTEFDSKSSHDLNGGDDDDDDDSSDDDDHNSSVYSNDHHQHSSNDDDDDDSSSSEDSEGDDSPVSYHHNRLKHGPSHRRPHNRHHSISDLTASAQSLLGLNDDGTGKKKKITKKKVYDESNEEQRRIISLHKKRQDGIKKEKVRRLQLMEKQRAIREQEEQLKHQQEVEENNLERQRKQKIVELANESRVKARNYRLIVESKNQQQQQQEIASNKQNRDADDTKTVMKKSDVYRQQHKHHNHHNHHQHQYRHASNDDADGNDDDDDDDGLLVERKNMINEDKPIHRPSSLAHSSIISSRRPSVVASTNRNRPNSAVKVKQMIASNNLDWVDIATNGHHPGKQVSSSSSYSIIIIIIVIITIIIITIILIIIIIMYRRYHHHHYYHQLVVVSGSQERQGSYYRCRTSSHGGGR
jgi:hypothetical protein